MINQKVIDMLSWVYSIFDIKLLTLIATGFTIYFGYQKVTKKLCVSYSISSGNLYDTHVTNLVVSNKRDNSIAISSIILRIGSKGSFKLVEFDEPLVLKSYDTKLIDVPKYSDIYDENGPVTIDFFEELFFSIVTMSGDVIECVVESSVTRESLEWRLQKKIVKFNDIVLTNQMGYVFLYNMAGSVKNVIFDRYGMISGDTPFKYNVFPEMSSDVFRDFLIKHGYHEYYENYALYKITDSLRTELVLSKKMVNSFISN